MFYFLVNRITTVIFQAVLVSLFLVTSAFAQTIVVLGDSLSAAYQMDEKEGWVYLLQQRINKYRTDPYQVINASISGDTTAGGLSRISAVLSDQQPDIVLIELGANDGLRGLSLKQMKNNLTQIITLAQAQGANVLLTEMSIPPNYGEIYRQRFKQVFHSIANSTEVPIIPFPLHNIGGIAELIQSDGLHPNAKAQPLILDNIWPHLQPLLTSD
jgi:acyl-CoA thioesterase-1